MSSPGQVPDPVLEQPGQLAEANPSVPQKRRTGLLVATVILLLAAGSVLSVYLYNEIELQSPLDNVLASERNRAVTAKARFNNWIDTDTVVFDLKTVRGDASSMDVFRVLLQFAQSQKENKYSQVILAAYGEKKFIVPGDYFQQLGQEYGSQNPMYTVRTFAHHVSTMSGEKPFPEYTGGLLGVLGKEMEEFSDMNKQWFLDDYAAKNK